MSQALDDFMAQLDASTAPPSPSNGRLVIGYLAQPIGGFAVIQQCLFDSIFAFCARDTFERRVFAGYAAQASGYIASGRDEVCKKFLEFSAADWLLMVDWDITFSPEAVYALLDAADPVERPIVAGCYVTFFGEGNRLRPCWMYEEGGQEFVPANYVAVGEVVECTVVGMGFTLIHRNVLEAMKEAFADDPWHWFGHDNVNDARIGEDLTFCHRARSIGFKVWGHGGVLLGHTKAKTWQVPEIGGLNAQHHFVAAGTEPGSIGPGEFRSAFDGKRVEPQYASGREEVA